MNTKAPVRSKVVALIKRGQGARAIALELGISVQRVYQHIDRARQLGELPPREGAA
jgi:DNA-binding CsgD family transcriptional regulator